MLFPESDHIQAIRHQAQKDSVPVVSKAIGSALQVLVGLQRPKNILELGTGYALASLLMLEAGKDARLTSIEINPTRFQHAKEHLTTAGQSHRVELILGDVREPELLASQENLFDFILIDAAKAQYAKLLTHCAPLLTEEGLLCFTDIYLKGRLQSGRIDRHRQKTALVRMRSFLKTSLAREDFAAHVLDIDDGLLLLQRKETSYG